MIIQGYAAWAKVLKLVANYGKDGQEWSIDVGLEPETVEQLNEAGLGHKVKPAIREKDGKEHTTKLPYIKFVTSEFNYKGEPNRAPTVVNRYGEPWDMDRAIGNGSTVNVMFDIGEGKEYGGWRKPFLRQVQVWDYVPAEPTEEFDYAEPEPITEESWAEEEEG
jgi:hypothetical protein